MNDQGKALFLPGMTIGHRYELLKSLRSEAHGEVMLARDQVLDLDVCLKLLSNEHPEFSRLLEYYRREALWGLRLHHPQILGVHHLDESSDGVFLILEPFVGNSLWELLGHSEALTINDSLYFIEVLAQGVAYGHKHGVNHQNFNPQQVLVSATDGIKIINFAFPAEPSEIHAFPEMPVYIAPEIWQGRLPTAASNLFSLGVIGYRMLTGTFPFPLQPEGSIPYQIIPEPVAFEKIPQALQPLFSRCLKAEPEKRFQSAADFLTRLSALREKLTPGYAIKNKASESDDVVAPAAAVPKTAPPPAGGAMEPEVAIDSDWQESTTMHRQSFGDKANHWFTDQQQKVHKFLGPDSLRQNRKKQAVAVLGGGLAFLFLLLGLNSLFSPKAKLKMVQQPHQISVENPGPALQEPASAKTPQQTASPASTQEIKPEPVGTKSPPEDLKASADKAVPLAVPVPATKKPAAPAQAKAEKPKAKPEKNGPSTGTPPTDTKTAKSETSPKLVTTLDKEIPARKKADELTKQGQRAIVKKAKQGDKTVYQIWLINAGPGPAKSAVPTPKPKVTANTNAPSGK